MKIFVLLTGMVLSFLAAAADTELWWHIGNLNSKVSSLTNDIEALRNDIHNLPRPKNFVIGEEYSGGIIFWLDSTHQHGLIVAKKDAATNIQWRNGAGFKVTNAGANGIGGGKTNTAIIIAQQTIDNKSGNFAALAAANFKVEQDGETPCTATVLKNCFSDWYLPSAYELALLYKNAAKFLGTPADYYWSSTETSITTALLQDWSTGELIETSKASTIGHVRPVKSF